MIFSVIIPTYNREKEVCRAIRSVLSQQYHNYEIIVVDDGSIDNTKERVLSFNDNRIRYVYQDNQGATAARNNGVVNAKGEYVSFLDSDDVWLPEMLEKQLEMYMSDPDIKWVYSNVQGVDENGMAHPFSVPLGIHGYVYAKALIQGYVAPTTVLSAKRDAICSVGMFDVNLPSSQDDDICFKLAKHFKCGYIPQIMASMFYDPNNRISDNKPKVAKGWWMLWNKYERDVIDLCGDVIMRKHYLNCLKRFIIVKDEDLINECMMKVELFGKKLNFIQKNMIAISSKTHGTTNAIMNKMLFKILK